MKKTYISPIVEVEEIQQMQLLCASPQNLDSAPLDILQDDEDDIQDIEDIW